MKFFLSRCIVHCTIFVLLCLTAILLPNNTFSGNWKAVTLTVVSMFAIINGLGEIAFARFARKRDSSGAFKIMVIRTIKFLLYLCMTLPLVWDVFCLPEQNKLYYGLLIVVLFFLYVIVEFSYFAGKEKT